MSQEVFYITTAIDYTNGAPHIGHAYEKILADAIARYHRLLGREVYFLTGVDQHGQKVQQTAEREGKSPENYVAEVTQLFLNTWQRLDVRYDGWAATTEAKHKRVVQSLLQQLYDAGQIYKSATTGWYSERQEQFLNDKDRNAQGEFGPEWGKVEEREEENYYFKLSGHVEWLVDFLDTHPDWIFPANRQTQLRNAAADSKGQDLCISRPKSRLTWGIELPFDQEFVTFVWFDALTNYISFAGFRDEDPKSGLPQFSRLWPCDAHVIGKDILVPAHGIYWLIMLRAIGIPDHQIPKILVHGFINISGEKMSKTLGNVLDPNAIADVTGVDGLRYFLLSELSTGQDGDISEERVIVRYNKELADVLGNLLNRSLNMAKKYLEGRIQDSPYDDVLSHNLRLAAVGMAQAVREHLPTYQIHKILGAVFDALMLANGYIEQTQPFKLWKDEERRPQVVTIMRHLLEVLAHAAVVLEPVIPTAARKIQDQLNWHPPKGFRLDDLKWGMLPVGHELGAPVPVFPKIELLKVEST